MAGDKEIHEVIENGVVFRKVPSRNAAANSGKVKTKAKKKKYITGAHGSGAAKMKAQIRERRANRHKK